MLKLKHDTMRGAGLVLMMGMLLLTGWTQVRAQLADDFSSGTFSHNCWRGDTSHFRFISSSAIPPSQQPAIQLYQSGAGSSLIYHTEKPNTMMEWQGWYKLSFNPSASNYAKHYLTANHNFPSNKEGSIFVGIGMVNDRIGIYQHQGSQMITLLTDTLHLFNQSTNQLRFRVVLKNHWWYLEVDPTGDQTLQLVDSFHLDTPFDSAAAGICCQYTSSNATKFYVDDVFCGPLNIDTIAPQLLACTLRNQQEIEMRLNEPLHSDVFNLSGRFMLNSLIEPLLTYPTHADPMNIRLIFSEPFPENILNHLIISNLSDKAGNIMKDTLVHFIWHTAGRNEMLISEIMADPSPPAKLPESEYIEIYNPTLYNISLCDWKLWIDDTRIALPGNTIEAGGYRLLINEKDTSLWLNYPNIISVSKLTLRNEGACLALEDHQGRLIHSVCYLSGWHGTSFQADGGYSLELKDSKNPCDHINTWITSSDITGGTPGKRNSYQKPHPDFREPYPMRVTVLQPNLVRVEFNEPIDTARELVSLFGIEGSEHPFTFATLSRPLYNRVDLGLGFSLKPDTVYHLVQLDTLADCAGNFTTVCRIPFGIPGIPDSLDLLFNEIMFKPGMTGMEYLEFLNHSSKIIDLSMLLLAKVDTLTHTITGLCPLTETSVLVFPGDHPVITKDVQKLLNQHPGANPALVILNAKMPNLPDQGDVYALLSQESKMIDMMQYGPEFHAPIYTDSRGIALERLSAEIPGILPDNWFSASEASGWGTPTHPNSQFIKPEKSTLTVEIDPSIFSPTGLNSEPFTCIRIYGIENGTMITIIITDETGVPARYLAKETLTGGSDLWRWDGTNQSGQLCQGGIHVAHVFLYHPANGRKSYRLPILLLAN